MKTLPLLLALALAGCSTAPDPVHAAHVAELRARLPYVTRMSLTHSMATVLDSGTVHLVTALPYDRLQTGAMVVYWPAGQRIPMCHFVGHRIGTDSWETHGMNQPGDIVYLGTLLTRENYIGVIQ